MIFELRGVEFHNKGAELMLQAIVQKVLSKDPEAKFVMAKKYGASIRQIRNAGFFVKLNFKKFGINTEKLGELMPKFIRRRMGFILEREVDVILEGSGFAYGDFFGHEKAASKMTNHFPKWKSYGIKIVMLPQAFGPFTDNKLKERMIDIIKNSDIIFARDSYSYDYLTKLYSNANKVFLKPDFTNLVTGKRYEKIDDNNKFIAIIPNNKLLESGVFVNRDAYLEVLYKIVRGIQEADYEPLFLIHEGERDLFLAQDVNKKYTLNVDIIKEEDPLLVKGIIGQVKGLVTSRFHGLVSGLSQSVPSLCIGWSHKYKALLEDYNFSEGLIDKEDMVSDHRLSEKLDIILGDGSRKVVINKLKESSGVQKARSEEMWDHVFKVIGS